MDLATIYKPHAFNVDWMFFIPKNCNPTAFISELEKHLFARGWVFLGKPPFCLKGEFGDHMVSFTGTVGTPDDVTEDALWEEFVAFAEQRGWQLGGGHQQL
ncbi:hypothetical protein ACP26L_36535 (plasmid) [Paenibacillus sp. S-38]|uniref:hypothetical protein n=1 Tax=Paenibacillus sp. S-38 TaxID=3416710 RepID=UPI003CE6BB19